MQFQDFIAAVSHFYTEQVSHDSVNTVHTMSNTSLQQLPTLFSFAIKETLNIAHVTLCIFNGMQEGQLYKF